MRRARAAQPPIVAPTIAPVEMPPDEAVVDGFGLVLTPAPACELFDDDDEGEEEDEEEEDLAASPSELDVRDDEDVGQPIIVGEVAAQPSIGCAKACPPLALWLKALLAVSPSSL